MKCQTMAYTAVCTTSSIDTTLGMVIRVTRYNVWNLAAPELRVAAGLFCSITDSGLFCSIDYAP